jgi:thiol-disulfide isomerase/thioredoxin
MKKNLLNIFIAYALVAFVTSCDTTVLVTGTFTLEQNKEVVVTLVQLSHEKTEKHTGATDSNKHADATDSGKQPVKLETNTNSQSGFSFDFEIPKPALFALYLRIGQGNELSGYNTTLYLEPGDKISLEFVPSGKYGVKCNHESISNKNNKALIGFGEATNSILSKNFNNPPKDLEAENAFLGSFSSAADSILGETKVKPLVRKFIKTKALDNYYSALLRSSRSNIDGSANKIPDFKIEYFDDDFIFLFPSGIQNLVGVMNLKTGLAPYSRRKDLSVISSHADLLELTLSNQNVLDSAIEYMLNAYIASFRDYENFQTNREKFSAIANRISNPLVTLELMDSFEKLGYTIEGSIAPPIKMEDRNGNMVSLETFKGKKIIVDVWATWCVPCLRQMPLLKELEHEMKDQNVVFVGICMGSKKEDWLQKLDEFGLDNIQLFDAGNNFANALNINAVPHILIYDPQTRLHTYQTTINQLK